MIEKIAAHIADFTPRLQSNTRATYQYCAMPVVQYRQLEDELFCNIYYLRHLCDTQHFPDWPIKEPVSLSLPSSPPSFPFSLSFSHSFSEVSITGSRQ